MTVDLYDTEELVHDADVQGRRQKEPEWRSGIETVKSSVNHRQTEAASKSLRRVSVLNTPCRPYRYSESVELIRLLLL